jgi:hypothetical protein
MSPATGLPILASPLASDVSRAILHGRVHSFRDFTSLYSTRVWQGRVGVHAMSAHTQQDHAPAIESVRL